MSIEGLFECKRSEREARRCEKSEKKTKNQGAGIWTITIKGPFSSSFSYPLSSHQVQTKLLLRAIVSTEVKGYQK